MRSWESSERQDWTALWVLVPMIGLLIIGEFAIQWASMARELAGNMDASHDILGHSLRILVGGVALLTFARIRRESLERIAPPLMALSLVLLVAVLILGDMENNARRRFELLHGVLHFQPSDLARFALVLYLASFYKRKKALLQSWKGVVNPLIVILLAVLLILLEPDFSTAALLLLIGVSIIFAAGVRLRHFLTMALIGGVFLVLLGLRSPTVQHRLETFFGRRHEQVERAMIGIAQGGLVGAFGRGQQKLFYPHDEIKDDFIFAVLGEELGFAGSFTLLGLYGLLFLSGFRIAYRALHLGDIFGGLSALGMTLMLAFYALAHIGVNAGLLPPTGIPLPFVSYGGSAMLVNMAAVGVILHVERQLRERPWVVIG